MYTGFENVLKFMIKVSWHVKNKLNRNYVESVRIRSYSGPHFPAFELNTERHSVSLRIQSECGKMRPRITPNTDTFYAVRRLHSYKTLKYYIINLNYKIVVSKFIQK